MTRLLVTNSLGEQMIGPNVGDLRFFTASSEPATCNTHNAQCTNQDSLELFSATSKQPSIDALVSSLSDCQGKPEGCATQSLLPSNCKPPPKHSSPRKSPE